MFVVYFVLSLSQAILTLIQVYPLAGVETNNALTFFLTWGASYWVLFRCGDGYCDCTAL